MNLPSGWIDYGLTPRALTVIVLGTLAVFLAVGVACFVRRRRDRLKADKKVRSM